jgi:hypothetical protein
MKMANITIDIQTYVNELIVEQLGYLDHKGRSITPDQKSEEKDNNFKNSRQKKILQQEQLRRSKMEKRTFSVPSISCGHCVRTIKNELSELEGVSAVEGSPAEKLISA